MIRAQMSLWTAPDGWRHEGMEALWTLSTLRLRRLADAGHFNGLELVTDAQGEAWARGLGLPFTRITRALDALPRAAGKIWSAGKLLAYSQWTEPTVHIDGDVLLKRALPEWLVKAPFFFERAEVGCPCRAGVPDADLLAWDMPADWRRGLEECHGLSYNFGIAGATAWREFAGAATRCLDVVLANCGRRGHGGTASVFIEQWCMTRQLDPWRIATLLPAAPLSLYAARGDYRHLAGGLKISPGWLRSVQHALDREAD